MIYVTRQSLLQERKYLLGSDMQTQNQAYRPWPHLNKSKGRQPTTDKHNIQTISKRHKTSHDRALNTYGGIKTGAPELFAIHSMRRPSVWDLVASSGVIADCSELNNPHSHTIPIRWLWKNTKKTLSRGSVWLVCSVVATVQ